MLIPVQAGKNRIQITFTRTWDRTLGGIISAITALFFGGLVGSGETLIRRCQCRAEVLSCKRFLLNKIW